MPMHTDPSGRRALNGGGAGKAITQEVKLAHRGQEMLIDFAATKGRARVAAFHLSLIPEN